MTAWRVFEERLVGRSFVAGETFTLGDLCGIVATEFLIRVDLEPPAGLRDWHRRGMALPALGQAFADADPVHAAMLASRKARMQ